MNSSDMNLLDALREDSDPEVTQVDSLCMNCHENGTTRLLLTRLKFFNEVLVSSFVCDKCGFENRSIDPVGGVRPMGQQFHIKVESLADLNRKIARPAHSIVDLGELGTFPSREGSITTIEGLFTNIIDNIEAGQENRRKENAQMATKLDEFIANLKRLLKMEYPISFVLDDPSGNGIIENPFAPAPDPQVTIEQYKRSKEQNTLLGFAGDEEGLNLDAIKEDEEEENKEEFIPEEVMHFQSVCPACNSVCGQNMKTVSIPHFKEVIIMALSCDKCGFRDSEVKSGGGIEPKGRSYNLHIVSEADLKRDVLKAESALVKLPELEIEALSGTLNDRFTTVEGLLQAIYDDLSERNPFIFGDSADGEEKRTLRAVLDNLKSVITGQRLNVHFILDDPAGNSYVQNYYAPDPDPEMIVELYERTEDQNDSLGLLHMKTENYENPNVREELV